MVSSLDDRCLDKAIEGIIDTALEAGHFVDVQLVTDRLLIDFEWLRLDKQAVYSRVAAE
jgi:hypothetical protein